MLESDCSEPRFKAEFVGRFFLSTPEGPRRTMAAKGEETAPGDIGFDTGRGGRGGCSALGAGANGEDEDEDFEPACLLVHQLALFASLLASCSSSDLYASFPSALNSLLCYMRNETFKNATRFLYSLRPNRTPKSIRKALRTSYFLSKCIIGSARNGLMCGCRESGLV